MAGWRCVLCHMLEVAARHSVCHVCPCKDTGCKVAHDELHDVTPAPCCIGVTVWQDLRDRLGPTDLLLQPLTRGRVLPGLQ